MRDMVGRDVDAAPISAAPPAARCLRFLAGYALHELVLLAFYLLVVVAMSFSERTARQDFHLGLIAAIGIGFAVSTRWIRRHALHHRPHTKRIVLRFLSMVAIFAVYFQLRWVITAIHPGDMDSTLAAADLAVFGSHLSVAVEPYQTRFWNEWFGFFYWAYFYIIAAFVLAHALFDRSAESFTVFGFSIIVMHAVGWSCYFVIPGLGPYHHFQDVYAGPIDGRFHAMGFAAYLNGPLRDVFPSLHTGVMTVLTAHAFRGIRRQRLFYGILAPLMAFWTVQIIIATVWLRWHYTVDVLAGLLLAAACIAAGPRLVARWAAFRISQGHQKDTWT